MPIFQQKSERIIFIALLLEYVWICLSGGGFSSLANAPLFSIGVDPFFAFFYYLQIPQFILRHSFVCISLDLIIIALCLFVLFLKRFQIFILSFLLLILCIHYITLTGYIGHRNFQSGYVWICLPFLFSKEKNRNLIWEFLRYYIIFFYTSASFLKVYYGGIFDSNYVQHILSSQLLPYYAEGNHSWVTSINSYLIKHKGFAHFLYVGGWLIELLPVIGFFTKKYDWILFSLLLLFHFINWIIMDIAPIGQITLLLSFILLKWNEHSNKID